MYQCVHVHHLHLRGPKLRLVLSDPTHMYIHLCMYKHVLYMLSCLGGLVGKSARLELWRRSLNPVQGSSVGFFCCYKSLSALNLCIFLA